MGELSSCLLKKESNSTHGHSIQFSCLCYVSLSLHSSLYNYPATNYSQSVPYRPLPHPYTVSDTSDSTISAFEDLSTLFCSQLLSALETRASASFFCRLVPRLFYFLLLSQQNVNFLINALLTFLLHLNFEL